MNIPIHLANALREHQRSRRSGRPRYPAEYRFWIKVLKTDTCWLWTASTIRNYGQFKPEPGKVVHAHRWAYEQEFGPIPEGLVLDHLCKVTLCVRPDHLEAVTISENVRRSDNLAMQNSRRTHCVNGHEFNESNTAYTRKGYRRCRACHYIRGKQWRKSRK